VFFEVVVVIHLLAAAVWMGGSVALVFAGVPAIRVLVSAVKERSGPLSLLSGFVLAEANGKPTAQAETILRDGAALPLAGS